MQQSLSPGGSLSPISARTLNTIASALESLSVAKKDPEEFCWSSRDWLMEKGCFFPSLIVPVDSH